MSVANLSVSDFIKPELKRLSSRQYRVIELALTGLRRIDIAKACEMTAVNVANILDSQLGQAELARRRKEQNQQVDAVAVTSSAEAARILDEASVLAANKVVDLAQNAESQKVQLSAAAMILERQGLGRAAAIQPVTHITVDRLQVLIQAFAESNSLSSSTKQLTETPCPTQP